MAHRRLFAPFLAAAALLGCEPPTAPEGLILTPVSFADLPGWTADPVGEAVPALARSCERLAGQPDGRAVGPGDGAVGASGGCPSTATPSVPCGTPSSRRDRRANGCSVDT